MTGELFRLFTLRLCSLKLLLRCAHVTLANRKENM